MAAVEVEEMQGGGLQTAKDLFSGAVGGVAQVLIGKCLSEATIARCREVAPVAKKARRRQF